jgi:hypothetical protein
MARKPTIDKYREWKMRIIQRDMGIRLTSEQRAHFGKLTTEIQIDNYARSVIDNAWG